MGGMPMSSKVVPLFSLLIALAASPCLAQQTDSPQVKMHIDAARNAAGTEWLDAWKFFCDPEQKNANKVDDPVMEPAKIFDNLYAIGRTSTIIYALDTPEGLILLDTG